MFADEYNTRTGDNICVVLFRSPEFVSRFSGLRQRITQLLLPESVLKSSANIMLLRLQREAPQF